MRGPFGSRSHVSRAIVQLSWLAVVGSACDALVAPASRGASASTALTRGEHDTYFPIGDGSKHAQILCSDCHQDATSFAAFTCQSCHAHAPDVAEMRHRYITGFVSDSNACVNCHPRGWEAPILPADHSLKYFPIQSGSHDNLLCSSCHSDASTSKVFVCVTCHDERTSADQHRAASGYGWSDAACYGCHPQDK